MKINVILYSFLRTGGVRILLEYASRLNACGHNVTVIHTYFPYKLSDKKKSLRDIYWDYRDKTVNVLNKQKILKSFGYDNLKTKFLFNISEDSLPDADATIFSYWPIAYKLKGLSSKKGRFIYLIQAYEDWFANTDWLHETYKMGYENICVSENMRKKIFEVSGVDSKVILNGLNTDYFDNKDKIYGSEQKTILFFNYEIEFKGVTDVLWAIDKAVRNYNKIKIISMGWKKPVQGRDYIKSIRNPDDKQIIETYCASDIFISASKEESFYLTPAEAMSCKCAVITSKVGAVSDYSEHMVSALHFTPGGKETLYSHLVYLLENNGEIERIANNGYKSVRERLNWGKPVRELESILFG